MPRKIPTQTRTQTSSATKTQVIVLSVLGLAAAAALGYFGSTFPRNIPGTVVYGSQDGKGDGKGYIPPGYRPQGYLPPGYLPSGYLPSGYLPPGYFPPGYVPPGYHPVGQVPPGYQAVGLAYSAPPPCSYVGWYVKAGIQSAQMIAKSTLVKGQSKAIYWYGADGKRYVFPNEKTYRSWYPEGVCPTISVVTNADLAKMPLGGNVTYRPGVRLLKIISDPKVYAVAKGGVLRWVENEMLAELLYGPAWKSMSVDDIPDAFFVNHIVGQSISQVQDYSPAAAMAGSPNIDTDKGL